MKKSDARRAIEAETHRGVGGKDTLAEYVSAIVPVDTTRIWCPVQCHDESGKKLMGMRTWGLRPAA